MWNIFKKKVKSELRDEYTRQTLVMLSRKIPSIGSIILKIGDKFYKCRQVG